MLPVARLYTQADAFHTSHTKDDDDGNNGGGGGDDDDDNDNDGGKVRFSVSFKTITHSHMRLVSHIAYSIVLPQYTI